MLQIYAYTPYMWPLLLSGFLAVWLSWRTWQKRQNRLSLIFSGLMSAVAVWSLAYMLSILAVDPPTKLFWSQLKYVGIVAVGPLWFLLAVHYVQYFRWLRAWWLRAAIIVEGISLLLVFTNDRHRLWWIDIHFVQTGPFPDLEMTWGWPFWVHTVVSYGLLLAGAGLYIFFYRHAATAYRRQTLLLIAALLVPLAGNLLTITGLAPAGLRAIDFTPFMLMISGLIMAVALFRLHLFDLAPIARLLVVEQMGDGVVVVDDLQRIVDLNPAAQEILALSKQQSIGAAITAALPEGVWRQAAVEILSAGHGAQRLIEEEERVYELNLAELYDDQGSRRRGHILTLHDVTEHKAIQTLLTRMMRITAHDLRTPLATAVGYLSLVLETDPALTTATRANLGIVGNALDRIGAIINDFLDLERVRSGAGMLHETFTAAELLQAACNELTPLAAARGQAIHQRCDDRLPELCGDPRLLQQALINLLTNALRYTTEGGEVALSASYNQSVVSFAVSDHGPGITLAYQEHLFEPFYRVPDQAGPTGSSGLGLSLVKAIVEAHGGRVWVQSQPGQGSTFGFDLPIFPLDCQG